MTVIEQLPEEVRNNDKHIYLRKVTKRKNACFVWYLICKGFAWKYLLKLRQLFSLDIGHPIFSASISFNCLVFLKTIASFENAITREERRMKNRFAAFRELFEEYSKCCAKDISPDGYITIDETLYTKYSERSYIIQDVQQRQTEWLLRVFAVLGVLTFITCFFYKQHFYKQRQTEIGKKSSKS